MFLKRTRPCLGRQTRFWGLGFVALACLSCEAFVGDYQLLDEQVLDTSALCEIERDQFIFEPELEDTSQQNALPDYYASVNPELIGHFADLASRHAAGTQHRGVTYLQGAAGVGKSFLIRNALDGFADGEKCEIELSALFTERADSLGFATSAKPDLATLDGEVVINQLPAIESPRAFALEELLGAGGCLMEGAPMPLIVIDGIDELQGDSSKVILRSIDDYLLALDTETRAFVHVLVAGRPEGFSSWLSSPERTERNSALATTYVLVPPRYRTGGDLDFRLQGYLDFTDQLQAMQASGRYAAYLASFREAVASFGFLAYSLGNLSVGNVVIEHTAPGLDETESELKDGLFDDIVYRDAQSHGRPGDGSPYEGAYRRALEDIAAGFADVSSSGVFSVRSEDTVELRSDEGTLLGRVRVRDVLDRGGVAFLTSATSTTTRYRFEPFWLHAHLIERRNRRVQPGYHYRGCQP